MFKLQKIIEKTIVENNVETITTKIITKGFYNDIEYVKDKIEELSSEMSMSDTEFSLLTNLKEINRGDETIKFNITFNN